MSFPLTVLIFLGDMLGFVGPLLLNYIILFVEVRTKILRFDLTVVLIHL